MRVLKGLHPYIHGDNVEKNCRVVLNIVTAEGNGEENHAFKSCFLYLCHHLGEEKKKCVCLTVVVFFLLDRTKGLIDVFMRCVMTLYKCLLQDGVLACSILQGTQIKLPL